MRNIILKPWTRVCAALSLAVMAGQAHAQTVTTIGGGYSTAPYQGYQDGTTLQARFNQPSGLAMDPSANYLFVADCSNNVVRIITTPGVSGSTTMTLTNSFVASVTRGISHPVSVIVDASTNIYVLNRGNTTNGTLLEFNATYIGYPSFVATNASLLTNATAMAEDSFNNIYITAFSNTVYRVVLPNTLSVIGTITNPGARLQGIAVMDANHLAISDAGTNSGIWLMTVTNGAYTAIAGFNGIGDNSDTWPVPAVYAIFNRPGNIAKAGNGMLVIADQGNNRVKLLDTSGSSVSLLYGVKSNYWGNPQTSTDKYPGWLDGQSGTQSGYAESRLPFGVVVAPDGSVFASEDYYHVLRHVTSTGLTGPPPPPPPAPANLTAIASNGTVILTWSSVLSASSYNVKRAPYSDTNLVFTTIGNTTSTSFADPGLPDGSPWSYVVSAVGTGGESPNSSVVNITLPYSAVDTPVIGYITYPSGSAQFNPVYSSVTLNNDAYIVIESESGSQTYYTYTNTLSITNVPDPSSSSASARAGFTNGTPDVTSYAIASIEPALSIKAIGEELYHPNSSIASAQFLFVVGNPNIVGNNAAQFSLTDITTGAHLFYTTDGSDPSSTNPAATDIGVLTGTNTSWSVSFPISTNTLFKVIAYKDNYQPSSIVSNLFTPSGFQPLSISFGSSSGEPQSHFMARPGQFYYAPVTLNLVPNFGKMYSLQFNVGVTNGYTNIFTGNPIQPIVNGAGIDFFSMLMTLEGPDTGLYYPPADGNWYLPLPPVLAASIFSFTNASQTENVPENVFVNTNNNLLGIGWLFRTGFHYEAFDTNLNLVLDFDPSKQDLIQFSIAHDTLFAQGNGRVVVGAYSFQIPSNSVNGDQYFIQLGSPSATSDGVGAPGADIYIQSPTSSQAVTIGSPAYLVGDVAPFHWLNAGDFGDTNLDNADVMQVYECGIQAVNMPPLNSDLYAAMDSAGGLGAYDPVNNYWTNTVAYTNQYGVGSMTNMWNGNDLTINQMPFGDGKLDINDLYVTFRRSLDPSLVWFKRYWTNGMFVAVTNVNYAYNSNTPHALVQPRGLSASQPNYLNSSVVFSAGDSTSSAGGNVVQIPLTANVLGGYPLRVLGLNVTVRPLDGSPSISTPVTFVPSVALGSPTMTGGSKGAGNINAAWLNASVAGLSNSASIGTLNVTVPTNVTSSSAYAVHFDFASGSPNGLAVFPKTTYTGLITTTPQTNSIYNDGIPDSWRLRWFGTVNNVLSASNACPSGDGVPNWEKYVAGVDPNVANDFPSVKSKFPVPSGSTTAIHWPSVLGKQYVIQRSTSLYDAPWTVLSTNTGTGGDMEFDDNSSSPTKFYRVQILP